MTAALAERCAVDEQPPSWEYLLEVWQQLDVPEGWRAEIDEGQITLVPLPDTGHNYIAGRVHRALSRALPDTWDVYQTLGVHIVRQDRLYIPDLVVMPVELLAKRIRKRDKGPLDAAEAEAAMVVEITSSGNAGHDRATKLHAYAHAQVPHYLLIDRYAESGPETTLYSRPEDGSYRLGVRRPFGELVELPEPFSAGLDTSGFLV
ncbi:Uma2 family endonuclease [Streptomyces sp. NPDC092296]|uniref:Uma2 family endonuclease n=1 Tax=Streptomyces sp. NPDC092296 TaxID=3366012 RepID=UPI0038012430